MSKPYDVGRVTALALLFLAQIGWAQPAAPGLASLAVLQPGQWELRVERAEPRSICLVDPDLLVQTRHSGADCKRLVIANEKNAATVHYTCPGGGWGRTSLTVETPRHVRIATQGIAANAPFDDMIDAHRTGDCPVASR